MFKKHFELEKKALKNSREKKMRKKKLVFKANTTFALRKMN